MKVKIKLINPMNTLRKIIFFLFGRRYWANIVSVNGTGKCEICPYIFHSKQEADEHCETIKDALSFTYIETVTFRSRNEYR